ncbi:MAG: N-acetyltransferase [Chloroflexota bacterium]|nr:N-acetyltransferase [Chloroflexota bacterium]MDE2968798.1 N-acetyltransferase [Chloroflexota bacterium]
MEGVIVRPETPADYDAVREVVNSAFPNDDEDIAALIEALRAEPDYKPELSLVAELGGAVVGHIIFTDARIETATGVVPAKSLGPLAVHPDCQGRGVGTQLGTEGLEACRRLGHRIAVVIGHSTYYPRFGFQRGRPLGIEMSLGRLEQSRMIVELVPGALDGVRGTVYFSPVFGEE